jgi:hypothetical protein
VLEKLVRIVIDDLSASLSDNLWQRYSARQGSRGLACGHQGWKDGFTYLNEGNNRASNVSFLFIPPTDGCYLVEEFHPADDDCQKPMAKELDWTIHYGRGAIKSVHEAWIQPAGNKWNTVALLPFYTEHGGKVVVKRAPDARGWVVADAFRFTRVATECQADAASALARYSHLAQHPFSVVLDNHVARIIGQAAAATCPDSAILGSAHVSSEQNCEAEYTFEPQSSGCYRVDEYHPVHAHNCPVDAGTKVRVEHLDGRHWEGLVAMAADGGKWNTLGHFAFGAGVHGKLMSKRADELYGSYWATDAFRFTWVAKSCRDKPIAFFVTIRISGVEFVKRSEDAIENGPTTNGDLHIALQDAFQAFAERNGVDRDIVRLLGLRHGSIIAEYEISLPQSAPYLELQAIQAFLGQLHGNIIEARRELCLAANAQSPCTVEVVDIKEPFVPGTTPPPPAKRSSEGFFQGMSLVFMLAGLFPPIGFCLCVMLFKMLGPPKKEMPFNLDNYDKRASEKQHKHLQKRLEQANARKKRKQGTSRLREDDLKVIVEGSNENLSTHSGGSTATPLPPGSELSSDPSSTAWNSNVDAGAPREANASEEDDVVLNASENLSLSFHATPVGMFSSKTKPCIQSKTVQTPTIWILPNH